MQIVLYPVEQSIKSYGYTLLRVSSNEYGTNWTRKNHIQSIIVHKVGCEICILMVNRGDQIVLDYLQTRG